MQPVTSQKVSPLFEDSDQKGREHLVEMLPLFCSTATYLTAFSFVLLGFHALVSLLVFSLYFTAPCAKKMNRTLRPGDQSLCHNCRPGHAVILLTIHDVGDDGVFSRR